MCRVTVGSIELCVELDSVDSVELDSVGSIELDVVLQTDLRSNSSSVFTQSRLHFVRGIRQADCRWWLNHGESPYTTRSPQGGRPGPA